MKKPLISGAFLLVYADGAGRKEIPISDFKNFFIHGKVAGKTVLFDGVTIHFVIMAVADAIGNENHISIHIGAFVVRYSLHYRLLFLLGYRQFQFVIDSYIYEIISLHKKYEYYLRRAKELGLAAAGCAKIS